MKPQKSSMLLFAVALMSAVFLPVVCDAADLILAKDGRSSYSIVVRKRQPRGEAFVVEDFRSMFKQATGVELPMADASKAVRGRRIAIGIAPDGAGDEKLGEQEWRVVTTADGDLHLYGGGNNGARLAVYDFLQNVLGFRFFDMHGGIKVPDLRTCRVPPQNRRRKPSFRFRYLTGANGFFYRPESWLFLFRNGQNGWSGRALANDFGIEVPPDEFDMKGPIAHSLRMYLPADSNERTFPWIKEQGGPDLKTAHPEYFSMASNGKRLFDSQYCLSNPGCRKLLKERVLENIRRNPGYNVFDLSAGDTPGQFCHCAGCKALMKQYGTPAGPLVDFIIELCPEVKARFPGVIITSLAYRKTQTQPPPKNLARLPDNFMPDFAPINDNFAKDWRDPSNTQTYEDLKGWSRLCRDVMVWYYPNPYSGVITPPLGNVERGAVDIKLMAEAGVTAHIWEHDVGTAWALGFTELQSYVYLRLMTDVSLDWRSLADEFIEFEYGAAADGFRRYWMELEALRKSEPLDFAFNARPSAYRHLTPERMLRWNAAFDAMEKSVANDERRLFAVRRARINLDYAMLNSFHDMRKAGIAVSAADLSDRIMATAKLAADAFCSRGLDRQKASFIKSLGNSVRIAKAIKAGDAKPLPRELIGGIPEDRLFVTIPKAGGTPYEEDPDAAFGCRAVFTGHGAGAKLPVLASFEDYPGRKYRPGIASIEATDLPPRGKYKFYALGDAVLSQNCVLRIGAASRWDMETELGDVWEAGSYNKVKFYASLKFEGPAFYHEDEGRPDRVFCDRVVVVRE